MTEEQWETKKGRLLYRALAEFSDACDAPDLNPSCPFFARMGDGSPVCAEECKDILGDELSPAATADDAVVLGESLEAVRRPRPRPRRPSSDNQPFDCRRIYLHERHRPVDSWSMTSLINGMLNQFTSLSPDSDDPPRLERALEIKHELERRGVEFERVLRRGMVGSIVAAVFVTVFESLRDNRDDGGWVDLFSAVDPAFADRRAGGSAGIDEDGSINLSGDIFDAIHGWVITAPIEVLVERRVHLPADELLAAGKEDRSDLDVDAIWLVQRFTITYLERWKPSSLKSEWRYVHSQRPGCCAPGHMRDRMVSATELAPHLAELACERMDMDEVRDDPPLDVSQFLPIAVDALGRGDFEEAVSIYRMLHHVRPNDNEITNNLGFCLLPTDLQAAIEFLTKTLDGSNQHVKRLALLNLGIAQYVSGNFVESERCVARSTDFKFPGPFFGWMWSLDTLCDGMWTLTEVDDLDAYTAGLHELVQTAAAAVSDYSVDTHRSHRP